MAEKHCVLVFGATGLFGELLTRRLSSSPYFHTVAVARNRRRLDVLQSETGVDIAIVDREDPERVVATLNKYKPFAVVDCAGPFQLYGQQYGESPYRFAQQVLESDSHYIDIADAPRFVKGITALHQQAAAKSVTAIAGASSSPAISAAATDRLVESMQSVVSIETAIVPGNRARRTLSVMIAILGQIGQPYQIHRYGKPETVYGWSETRNIDLGLPIEQPICGRLASLVDTPEPLLFPARYQAATVTTRAGLEIKSFHRTLQFGGTMVRSGLVSSLAPFARLARRIASGFERIGSDVGGMQVCVTGQTSNNEFIRRTWDLVASDGYGPEIPTLPVSVILDKLRTRLVETGARASCGEITLDDLQPYLENIGATTMITEQKITPIFKTVLGASFDILPGEVQALHNTIGRSVYQGMAESRGPSGISGHLAALLFGFPAASENIPVTVTITADENTEVWQRNFSGREFESRLSLTDDGHITEHFGPLKMVLGLQVRDNRLHFPVSSAKLFGLVPIPSVLLPKSIASESVDSQGRFKFDVHLLTPFGARIAHYTGWLELQSDETRS